MSAPSLQPLPTNDARPPRPVYYFSLSSAEAAQHRAARRESPTQRVTGVEFAPGVLRAFEGGVGFAVIPAIADDYELVELSAADIELRVQAGIRYAVLECYEAAAKEDLAATKAKATCFKLMHGKWAAEHRERARELERRLTLSSVRRVNPEPITSSERDARHLEAR